MIPHPFPDHTDRSLADLVSLRGRTAVVTGAARGIGAAIVRRLAEAGAQVHAVDVHEEVREVALAHGAEAHLLDITDHAAVRSLADGQSRLDVWVNDAGVLPVIDAFDIDEGEWRRVVDTNLTATFFCCQAAGRMMRGAGRGGVIVNIASSLGFHSAKRQPHYVASKWGVRGLTAALASDWGQHGIRVVAVAPGLTDTEGVEANMAALDDLTGGNAVAATSKAYPAGRLGEPDDVARAVLFAVSDLAGFVTASTLLADGGEVYAT